MALPRLAHTGLLLAVVLEVAALGVVGRAQTPAPTFSSGIDLVRVSAVVRNHKGHFVEGLTEGDFEILDGGQPRSIVDFRTDLAGVSVGLLFDISGSMESTLPEAREAGMHLLSWLQPEDEAAVYTFDTRLVEV